MSDDRPLSKVRARRQEQGLRLVDLAAAADIAVGYLSMIENGYLPKPKIRERVAAALGCETGDLWPEVAA